MNYEMDGVIDENHPEFDDFDILQYWQVRLLTVLLSCWIVNACCS